MGGDLVRNCPQICSRDAVVTDDEPVCRVVGASLLGGCGLGVAVLLLTSVVRFRYQVVAWPRRLDGIVATGLV